MKMKDTIIYFVALLFLVSCKRKLNDVSWNSEVVAPLVTTSLTIEDLIKEDTNFVSSGKEITFVYNTVIEPFGLRLDTLITLGLERFKKTVKLETLELPEQNVSDTVYLGEVASGIGFGLGDGSNFPSWLFNQFPAISLGEQTVDFSQFLTSAQLSSGDLKLEIENRLDFVIEEMILKVSNEQDDYLILDKTINNLLPGETLTIEEDLFALMGGNPLEGKLTVEVPIIKFRAKDGALNVNVDYTDFFRYEMSITNIMVTEAIAVFQDQEVLNSPDTTSLQDMGDVVLTGALIDTGFVNVRAYNTIDAILDFNYDLIGLTKNGNSFSIIETLPASGDIEKDIPFIGYYLYLKGHPNPDSADIFNAFYSELVGNIRSTADKVDISLQDSIDIDLGFDNIKARYVEGYLGQDTFSLKTGVKVDAWNDFPLEGVDFKTINLTLFLENGLGVPGELIIKELLAINTKTNETEKINNVRASIAKAIEVDKELTAVETEVKINGATKLINIQPDSLVINFEIITNPNGNTGSYDNFIERVSYIRPSAKIEIPFELNAQGFTLNDTVDFSVSDFTIPDLLRDEKLVMLIDNNIPASGTIKAAFLNAGGGIIDEITTDGAFLSPSVGIDGEAIDIKRSSFVFDMPTARLEKILKAKKIVYEVNFSSSSVIDFVKIFSDNSLTVTLVGDVGLNIETK